MHFAVFILETGCVVTVVTIFNLIQFTSRVPMLPFNYLIQLLGELVFICLSRALSISQWAPTSSHKIGYLGQRLQSAWRQAVCFSLFLRNAAEHCKSDTRRRGTRHEAV
jgi:hypothetical protein